LRSTSFAPTEKREKGKKKKKNISMIFNLCWIRRIEGDSEGDRLIIEEKKKRERKEEMLRSVLTLLCDGRRKKGKRKRSPAFPSSWSRGKGRSFREIKRRQAASFPSDLEKGREGALKGLL